MDASKVEQKYTLTNKQYRQASKALDIEGKGNLNTFPTLQPLLSVLDSTQRTGETKSIIENDFCCLEAFCAIEHASKPTSDFAHQMYCQPIIVPNVVRRVTNLCSVFLFPIPQTQGTHPPEEEQLEKSEQILGGTPAALQVTATLDSGATTRDYVSASLAEQLCAMGAREEKTKGTVCLARRGVCTQLHKSLTEIRCIYFNRETFKYETFTTKPTVFPNALSDFVIGLQQIFSLDLIKKLVHKPVDFEVNDPVVIGVTDTALTEHLEKCAIRFPKQFIDDSEIRRKTLDSILGKGITKTESLPIEIAMEIQEREKISLNKQTSRVTPSPTVCQTAMEGGTAGLGGLQTTLQSEKSCHLGAVECPACAEYNHDETSTPLTSSADYFPMEESDDEPSIFDHQGLPAFTSPSSEEMSQTPDVLESIIVEGNTSFQLKIREILERKRSAFSRSVRAESARVSPMELEVDYEKLKRARLSGRARPQSEKKLAALREMISKLLRLGVIRVSKEPVGSQVLLVVKKNTTDLRFCIDFRAINDATISKEGWPIPNIENVLREIGHLKGRFFGVMDMTSGYHQTPLSEGSIKWTSFITPDGMYEWTRVPMGIMGAPSYFSSEIMSTVLHDILHKIVLSYLDDLIIWGETEDEFLTNLEIVLQRLIDFNITINPDKSRFGMSEVEYVGHTINGITGEIHFTRSKLDRVRDFPIPQDHSELKMFIGLAQYYRKHIAHMSSIMHPLDLILGHYEKRGSKRKIKWNDEALRAFYKVRTAIDECPALRFVDPRLRVYVRTDASRYGMGAVMFQIDSEGVEHPIDFLSKSFSKTQLNWDTPEQEGYAIFYTLKRWEHLLRDVNFILETDHENLTFIKFDGSSKVKRWKMLLQEFRFDIRFIPGKNNVVADALSRLCLNLSRKEEPVLAGGGIDESDMVAEFAVERLAAMFELESEVGQEDCAYTSEGGTFQYMSDLHHMGWKFNNLEISEKHSSLDGMVDEMFSEMIELEKDIVIADDEKEFPSEIYEQIQKVHNPMVGHHGVQRTVSKLRQMGATFRFKRQWVEKFIKLCPGCNKTNERNFRVATIPYTLATYRTMQKLQIDAIGPLKIDEYGNRHILVIIDTFSRWVMLYPTESTDAEACVWALIQHMGLFGAPNEVSTDGGSQLHNELVRTALDLMGTRHNISIAYSSEEQGIVERENKEVLKHLRNFLFDKRLGHEWTRVLPFVQRILNAEVVSSIGYSPAQIVFGNAINLDRGIFIPNKIVECAHTHNFPKYIEDLITAQKISLEGARLRQRALDVKHMTERSSETYTEFADGSLVLLAYSKGLGGKKPPHKLMTKLKGPYVVTSHDGPRYRVKHLASNRIEEVHVTRMQPFEYDSKRTNPKEIAAADIDEFVVAAILDHKPKYFPKRSNLVFLVKWDGYDETHNSWEPWEVLRNNSICHTYCSENKLRKFVPRNIQQSESEGED